ncbi:MAG: hypothetical protein NZM43_04600 [Saprospiraceae bacterium]|nr:hypothetical protein [Saprospiraceae bacterium]MDW8483589.1 hypothetical protein [Saprospiraceae bacterium]
MSFFEYKIDPLRQSAVFVGASVAFMLVTALLRWIGISAIDRIFPWSVAAAFLLLYAVFVSVMSLNASSGLKYWGRSMYGFAAVAAGNGIAAWLISGLTLSEARSYRWTYVVITICFLVFLSILNLMRKIVAFAEREEWNAPRRRKRR